MRIPGTNPRQANAFAPNWGQAIFQTANEIANNTMLRKRLDELQAQTEPEKEWWDKRKAEIQSEFMKELDEEDSVAAEKKSDDDGVLVEGGGPSSQAGGKKNKKKGGKN
jgi:translocation protein SEC66